MNFRGKRVLITGAAAGIGKCLTHLFAEAGADLILWDKDLTALENLYRELKNNLDTAYGKLKVLHVDLSDEQRVRWAAGLSGDVDVLINNAGIGFNGELFEVSYRKMKKLTEVNLLSATLLVELFKQTLSARKGHIVNVSSGQAFFKLPTWSAYAATKSALSTWSELLSVELAKHGITVTTVYPFMVDTGFYNGVEEEADTWASKMAMKLLPYYSNKPETVAKKIFNAVKRKKRIEMVHPLNWVGYGLDSVPGAGYLVRMLANKFLSK